MVGADSDTGARRRPAQEIIADSRKHMSKFINLLDELEDSIEELREEAHKERDRPKRWGWR